jgi:hypothetical protein
VPAKCAMCGKMAIISDEHNSNKNENEQQQTQEVESSNIIELIDGIYYTFDTENCALMFKKFNAVYGSNFADG